MRACKVLCLIYNGCSPRLGCFNMYGLSMAMKTLHKGTFVCLRLGENFIALEDRHRGTNDAFV